MTPDEIFRNAITDGADHSGAPDVTDPGDMEARRAMMAEAFAGTGETTQAGQNKALAAALGVDVRSAQRYRTGQHFPYRRELRQPFANLVRTGRLSPDRQRSIIRGAAQLKVAGVFRISKDERERTIALGKAAPWCSAALLQSYKAGEDDAALGYLALAVGGPPSSSRGCYCPGMQIVRLDWVRMIDSDNGVGPDPNDWKARRRNR